MYQDDFMTVWNTKFEKHRNRAWAKKVHTNIVNLFSIAKEMECTYTTNTKNYKSAIYIKLWNR